MPSPQSKLTDEQKIEIVTRHDLGETQTALPKEFKVGATTISKVVKKAGNKGAIRGPRTTATPGTSMIEFAKRCRSILWRLDGKEKGTYNKWQIRVDELKRDSSYTQQQAIVQAAKDFPALKRLFREYDTGEFDPNPDSHPDIHRWGKPAPMEGIENEKKDLSFRENLSWAIETAGRFLRTMETPISCPNDEAYFLYRQACEQPKEFLGKFTQVEARTDDGSEEARLAKKSGKRSIDEIEEMLATLGECEKTENATP
ncbi:hypothetical protein LCGC14_2559240 [marine sediment metagenome]|uniref:HTH psq-type domain-containing protein n=1 Tax=marine sediment metagenome TaxID=412755 RepID=A0A0F9CWQ4_9ZZZZ